MANALTLRHPRCPRCALDAERERRAWIDRSSALWTGGSGATTGSDTVDLVLLVLDVVSAFFL